MPYHLQLLGRFALTGPSGQAIEIVSKKGQAMVARLALAGEKGLSREALQALLWSDRDEAQAGSSLRQALSALRRALGNSEASPLKVAGTDVALDQETMSVDVQAFATLAESKELPKLETAAELLQGELLQGLEVRDAAFENWLLLERQRLSGLEAVLLEKLLKRYEANGMTGKAVATGEQVLQMDPLREPVYRSLMRLHAGTGDRSAALRVFERCRRALKEELGLEPEEATKTLFEEITRGETNGRNPLAQSPLADATAGRDRQELEEELQLPEKPSIAVLPFTDLSQDGAQDFFADGLSEEIITALSRIPNLFVIGRGSTFGYRGRSLNVKQLAEELGVRYVLEGSLRQAGRRLRVTAQLIDAASGHHVWAERYDRETGDIFAIHDDITCEVAAALQIKLTEGEYARVRASGTKDLKAWECLIQAAEILYNHRRGEMPRAKALVEEALERDPNYAWGWAAKGWLFWEEAFDVWSDDPEKSLETAKEAFERATTIDPDNPDALALGSFVLLSQKKFDQARAASAHSLSKGAGYWMTLGVAANIEMYAGDPEVAMNLTRRAMRLCPIYPAFLPADLAQEHILMGNPEKAVPACKTAIAVDSGYIYGHLCLAVSLVMLGRIDEAKKAGEGLLGADPAFSISRWVIGQTYEDPAKLTLFTEALQKAGLPE